MLDDYKENQKISYRILKNSVKKNRNSHAYLFETRGYGKSLDFAIAFAKYLLCPNHHANKEESKDCFVCNQIEATSFPELKIIEPDGATIKKEQLLELKDEFNKKSINSDKKVYIINGAEKLNPSSSNSLLKFLEEPEENIVAILITDNKFQLLDTIISRCQIVTLNNFINTDNYIEGIANLLFNDENSIKEFIATEDNIEKINNIIKFILYYEKNGFNKTYSNIQKLLKTYKYDKNEIFEITINFYKDVLNYKINRNIDIFKGKEKDLSIVSENNTIEKLISKINLYIEIKSNIKYNMNSNLILDKLLIGLGEIE